MSTVDRLEIQVQANAQKANTQLDLLSDKLNKVSSSLGGVQSGGLLQLSNGVNHLASAMKNMSAVRATDFTRIATGIQKLSALDGSAIYRTSNALRNIANSLNGMAGSVPIGATNLAQLANSIAKLGYKTSANAIANIPKLSTAIKDLITSLSNAPQVSQNIINLTNALANLASQGNKVSTASKAVQRNVNGASNSVSQYGKTAMVARANTVSFRSEIMKLYTAFFMLKGIASTLWRSVEKAMDYGETINLFQTAFKKIGSEAAESAGYEIGSKAAENFAIGYIDNAQDFSDHITNSLSLDPDAIMNYQAIFSQIANAMGAAEQTAVDLGESFTMLGIDLSSLFNDDISESMDKLQQGLVGQVRGLREYGIDITEATLQTYAFKYGIEDSVSEMSQAAKIQLRYLAIMDQASVAFGDMAKTISSPANQLRILKQQWDNLCRTLGNIFLPIISTVLPYLNGLLIAIRNITGAFASLLGYTTPDYSDTDVNAYSDVTNELVGVGEAANGIGDSSDGIGDVAEELDDVTDSATKAASSTDKLNKSLAKFDEINNIGNKDSSGLGGKDSTSKNKKPDKTSGGSGSASNVGGGGYSQLDDAISKANDGYMAAFNEQLGKMGDKAKEISEMIQPKIEKIIEVIKKFEPAFKGLAAAFATYKIITLFGDLATKLAAIGSTKIGLAALVIGALVGIGTAIYECWEKAKENDLAKRFGDITLSAEELEKVAKSIVDNGTLDKLATAMSSWDELDSIKSKIDDATATLNKYNWKVSIGIELTEEDEIAYKKAIQEYVDASQEYVEQQHLAVALSIDLLVEDEDVKQRMIETSNKFYTSAEGELKKLGADLQSCVNASWEDGLLTFDEAQAIQKIQSQMADVMEQVAASNFTAKVQMLTMDFSGAKLTADSAKKLMEKEQELVDNAVSDYDEVTLNLLASVDAQFKAGAINTAEYEEQINAVKLGRLSNIGEITLNATKFNLNTIYDTFGNELEKRLPDFQKSFKTNVDRWFDMIGEGGEYEGNWGAFFLNVQDSIERGYDKLDPIAKSNLNDILEIMSPNKEQNEKTAKQWLDAGKEVPKNISEGLLATYYVEAIAGNTESLFKLITMYCSSSEERTAMLEAAKEAGFDVDGYLGDGIALGEIDLTTSLEDLIGGINTTISSQTTAIEKYVREHGAGIASTYADGMTSKEDYVATVATNMVKEAEKAASAKAYYDKFKADGEKVGKKYGNGITSSTGTAKTAAGDMVGKAYSATTASEYYEKVSQSGERFSKSFAAGIANREREAANAATNMVKEAQKAAEYEAYMNGKNVSSGYANGVNNGTGKVNNAMNNMAQGANDTFTTSMEIHSPSRLYERYANFTTEGFNGRILKNIGKTKSAISKWGDAIKEQGSKITVNPLDFRSNYTVNTSGIEGYADLMSDKNINLKATESINIDQTSETLTNLPQELYRAVYSAIINAPITANVDGNQIFNTVRKKSQEFFNQTGLSPIPV